MLEDKPVGKLFAAAHLVWSWHKAAKASRSRMSGAGES